MKSCLRLGFISLLIITLTSAVSERQRPRNLIIFIGDGMGVAQVYAAMTVSGNEMTFPAFPVTGISIRGHSETMVPLTASGPGAQNFAGVQDNADLFHDFYDLLSPGMKCNAKR